MNLSRREILQLLGISSLTASIPSWAQSLVAETKRTATNFVMIDTAGGWDVTLGLDPWLDSKLPDPQDMFVEYRPDDVFREGLLALGPAAQPLFKHAKKLAIVNGIVVSKNDQGHPASSNYMVSGSGLGRKAALPLELALSHQNDTFDVVVNSFLYKGIRSGLTLDTTSAVNSLHTEDLLALLGPLIQNAPNTALGEAQRRLLTGKPKVDELRRILLGWESSGIGLTPERVIAASFMAGVSKQGYLYTFNNLDTHGAHEGTHLEALKSSFDQVSSFIDLLESLPGKSPGSSLLDETVVMVLSEFSRTPFLNQAKGKDHNPLTNSVLLFGKNIRGGNCVGASRLVTRENSKTGVAYHVGRPIDYVTGQPAESRGGEFIFPENVHRTVLEALDVDWDAFQGIDQKIKPLPLVLN